MSQSDPAAAARILADYDGFRQSVERRLHDGAQQHLVALAVRLSLAAGSAPDPALLAELRAEVQAAIGELRELAHEAWPPLLRDRGLGEALRSAARRAASGVVDVELTQRFPPPAESAVYFCCIDLLSAGAGRIRVRGDAQSICFEARAGQVPPAVRTRMRDRLEALGGRLDLLDGGELRGSVPAGP